MSPANALTGTHQDNTGSHSSMAEDNRLYPRNHWVCGNLLAQPIPLKKRNRYGKGTM